MIAASVIQGGCEDPLNRARWLRIINQGHFQNEVRIAKIGNESLRQDGDPIARFEDFRADVFACATEYVDVAFGVDDRDQIVGFLRGAPPNDVRVCDN